MFNFNWKIKSIFKMIKTEKNVFRIINKSDGINLIMGLAILVHGNCEKSCMDQKRLN